MGQTIGWYKWDGKNKTWDDDIPDWFDAKWEGTFAWWIAILDAAPVLIEEDSYTGDYLARPGNFDQFRAKLKTVTDDPVRLDSYEEMTVYLEAHPDVYVNFG